MTDREVLEFFGSWLAIGGNMTVCPLMVGISHLEPWTEADEIGLAVAELRRGATVH